MIEKQNEKSKKIDKLGIKAIRTVWKRGYGSTSGLRVYSIHFDFKKGDEYLTGYIQTS